MTNQSTYILSLEANDIYCHMNRGNDIKLNYCGMIPYSLELIKLKQQKEFETFTVKHSEKEFSNDIINLKFKQKVKSGEYLIRKVTTKIDKLTDTNENYKKKLIEFMKLLESEKHLDKWQEVSNEDLRKQFYLNGFTITDPKGIQTKYVVYKRSSSKSRNGQCLFIKESLYQEMINWSRMYLPFEKDMEIDYASLLAYESLVLSSLEDTIRINPKNILIVDDVESKFKQFCNVIRKGKNGFLDSFTEEVEVTNSLFDGESLLDSKYFSKGQSMKLLRNHMFKSAAFNTNIQQFLKDHCPDNVNFDEWEIQNMFGEKMLAKDIEFIFTPTSLKALKFSHVVGSEKRMWNYWKEIVTKDHCIFGVCKHEKKSKCGLDEKGNTLQQTSYQMINCLPLKENDIKDLTQIEKEYINKLKNDDQFFIEHIIKGANSVNSNLMLADLYKINRDFANTKIFRDFRKGEINSYVSYVKKGKVRLVGDYCVLLGNPMEYLFHAIGKFDVNSHPITLKNNEIYTTLFDFNKDLVGFRNPNTSPSNVLVAKNTYSKEIHRYINLTDNIVCVNAVNFPIQDILSGCDYDSDTVLLFDDSTLLKLGKRCFGKYKVCINHVESQKKKYKLNNLDMSNIDNQLATSQKNIGRVVNIGQLCMSRYWDQLSNKSSEKELEELLKKIDVMTVLSGICIDLAKKFYEIDIEKEIKNVDKFLELKTETIIKKGEDKEIQMKPKFWQYVSQSKTIKSKIIDYNCPMDFLYKEMNNLPYAEQRENIDFLSLLVRRNIKDGNRKQEKKILTYVKEMCGKINNINATFTGASEDEKEEKYIMVEDIIKYYNFFIQRLTVKPSTMYAILIHMIKNKNNTAIKLMNVLYTTQKETFLNSFKQNKEFTLLINKPAGTWMNTKVW